MMFPYKIASMITRQLRSDREGPVEEARTGTSNAVSHNSTNEHQCSYHEILASFQERKLSVVYMHPLAGAVSISTPNC